MGGNRSIAYRDNYCHKSSPIKPINISDMQGTYSTSQSAPLLSTFNSLHKLFPFNCVGLLKIGTGGQGTGFLVAPNLVLTVAHNVYNLKARQSYSSLSFVLFEEEKVMQINVMDFKFCQKFEDQALEDVPENDYALLKLDKSVHREKYIELGIAYHDQQEDLIMSGFPINIENLANRQQVTIKDSHHYKMNRFYMHYQFTTKTGNSGSPVMASRWKGYRKEWLVIGMHKGATSLTNLVVRIGWQEQLNRKTEERKRKRKQQENKQKNGQNEGNLQQERQRKKKKDEEDDKEKEINVGSYISVPLIRDLAKWEYHFNKQRQINACLLDQSNTAIKADQAVFEQQSFKGWDETTSFSSHFQVTQNTVRMIQDHDKFIQITGKLPINKYYSTTRFRVNKYGLEFPIIFGITTLPLKYQRISSGIGQGSIGYWSDWHKLRQGCIKVEEKKNGINPIRFNYMKDLAIPPGEILQMDVDRLNNQIAFSTRPRLKNEFSFLLPDKFLNQDLYVYVSMADKDASVTLI